MLKKIFQPKVLAITTIISMIIYIFISLWNNIGVSGIGGLFITLLENLLYGFVYIITYLLIILFAKKKDIRKLNLILIIQLSISFIFSVIVSIINNSINLLSILPFVLLLVMIIGIYLHKKISYNIFMIIAIVLLMLQLFSIVRIFIFGTTISLIIRIGWLLNITTYSIGLFAFTMFMCQYGKSISQRSKKDE